MTAIDTRHVRRLLAEIADRASDEIECACPVPTWAPHVATVRHDISKGLIIHCHGGHTRRQVLEAFALRAERGEELIERTGDRRR